MPRHNVSEGAPSGDVGWNFGEMVDGNRHTVRCKLCGKVIKGGITRLKQHLAHERGQVDPCTKVSQEAREEMQLLLKEMRDKRSEKEQIKNELHKRLTLGDEIETDDDDDEVAEIQYARMQSMREYREMEEMQRFRAQSGQSYDVGGSSGGSKSKSVIGKAKKGFAKLFGLNRLSRGRPIDVDSPEMRLRAMDPMIQRSKSAKQPRIDERIMKGKREELGAAVSKLLIYERLPMAVADSPWLPALLEKAIDLGPGVKVPTPYEVGNKYLKQEYEGLRSWITGFKGIWKQRGVTIMCDGWTGTTQMHIINFLIYSNRGTVFHKSVDASLVPSRDADYYFKLMDDVVEEIGEDIVVQIVTDNEAAMKAAGHKLMRKRKHLYWTACAAHCMDLILEDIGKSKSVTAVLNDAKTITRFIYNSNWVANTMKRFTSGRQLLRPGITRFATNFIALQSIVREKEGLRNMFASELWKNSRWGKEKEGHARDVNQLINSDEFWKKARDVLKVHEPLLKVLRLVDGDEKPTMGFIYEAMDRAKLAMQRDCRYFQKYWKIIDNRWGFQLHTDLHAAGK